MPSPSSQPVRKAMILAAGLGTRLRPLTDLIPKPLLPLWGRPLLLRLLDTLHAWGVREALVNLHHRPEAILQALRREAWEGMALRFSFEPTILGTGGALRRAAWFLDEPFWLANADIALRLDPLPLRRAFRTRGTIAALWMEPTRGPRTVELARGRVTSFQSAHPGTPGTFTFCGLQLLSPRLLDFLPREESYSTLVAAYQKAMAAGHVVRGVTVPDATWADLGTPEQYLAAHADTAPQGATNGAGGFAAVAQGAKVDPRAQLHNAVVMAGARLGPHTRLRDAIVAENVSLDAPATRLVLPATAVLDAAERAALVAADWDPARAAAAPLAARGSARDFVRLYQERRTLMLIRYRLDRPENARFAGHARFLAAQGVRVPRVVHHDAARHFLLVEDFGLEALDERVPRLTPAARKRLYEHVLDGVQTFHRAAAAAKRARLPLEEPFGPALYRRERELFAEHYLRRHRGLGPDAVRPVLRELGQAARALQKAPQALLHRDLQSSNLYWVDGAAAFIDFQGMRYGPDVYDLASLLCDPYVMLDDALQQHLLGYYADRSEDPADLRARFGWGAVQRLIQALGAYGRLGALPGAERFLLHLPHAVRMLRRVLATLPQPLPHLDAVLAADEESRA